MAVWVMVLVIVGLVVFFALGLALGQLIRRRGKGLRPQEAGGATADVRVVDMQGPDAIMSESGVLGFGRQGGMEVFAARLPVGTPMEPARLSRRLSASSAIASEFERLAGAGFTMVSHGKDIYRVTVRDGDTRSLMRAAGGGRHGAVVDKATGRIKSQAVLTDVGGVTEAAKVVGPQAVWALAALAVGQHFEAEIAGRLLSIEKKVDQVVTEIDRQRLAELHAAREECAEAAFRILDGTDPRQAIADFSAHRQAIRTNWSLGLDGLAAYSGLTDHADRSWLTGGLGCD